eukprot:1421740-Alexandrium_andersonii.AAC.1
MSASLVGSEMCIRDSACSLCNFSPLPAGPGRSPPPAGALGSSPESKASLAQPQATPAGRRG